MKKVKPVRPVFGLADIPPSLTRCVFGKGARGGWVSDCPNPPVAVRYHDLTCLWIPVCRHHLGPATGLVTLAEFAVAVKAAFVGDGGSAVRAQSVVDAAEEALCEASAAHIAQVADVMDAAVMAELDDVVRGGSDGGVSTIRLDI